MILRMRTSEWGWEVEKKSYDVASHPFGHDCGVKKNFSLFFSCGVSNKIPEGRVCALYYSHVLFFSGGIAEITRSYSFIFIFLCLKLSNSSFFFVSLCRKGKQNKNLKCLFLVWMIKRKKGFEKRKKISFNYLLCFSFFLLLFFLINSHWIMTNEEN